MLVETEPAEAEVFVDGVFQVARPLSLPRSSARAYTVRVQAQGYLPEEQSSSRDRTQVLRVALRRRPGAAR